MKVIECKQGSTEWHRARMGIPTASQFHRILTQKTLKPSASAEGYRHELLAEWLLNSPLSMGEDGGGFMGRGRDLEAWAVSFYELQRDTKTTAVGFCLTDDGRAGCSPDRLVGDDGGLEIKCPGPAQHVANLLAMTREHYAQVQGCLFVTGRKWWDLLSYHPELPPALVRYTPDAPYQEALGACLVEFADRLAREKEALLAQGCEVSSTVSFRAAPEYPF